MATRQRLSVEKLGPSISDEPQLKSFTRIQKDTPCNQGPLDSCTNMVDIRTEKSGQSYPYSRKVEKIQRRLSQFYALHRKTIFRLLLVGMVLCYAVYFAYALYYSISKNVELLVLTAVFVALALYRASSVILGRCLSNVYHSHVEDRAQKYWKYIRWIFYVGIPIGLVAFILWDSLSLKTPKRLISAVGIFVFLLLGFLISKDRTKIPWKTVVSGIIIQFLFGLLILRSEIGFKSMSWLGAQFTALLGHAEHGAKRVFGSEMGDSPTYVYHDFVMIVMPMVIFFGAIVELLYYYGILQVMIRKFGGSMSFIMGIGPPEAFVAAANVFLGPNTSVLTIAPLLEEMTMSEIHCVLTSGFATVSGSLFGAYTSFGVPASHLIGASLMSAPAALLIAKVLYPETSKSKLCNAGNIEFTEP